MCIKELCTQKILTSMNVLCYTKEILTIISRSGLSKLGKFTLNKGQERLFKTTWSNSDNYMTPNKNNDVNKHAHPLAQQSNEWQQYELPELVTRLTAECKNKHSHIYLTSFTSHQLMVLDTISYVQMHSKLCLQTNYANNNYELTDNGLLLELHTLTQAVSSYALLLSLCKQ